MLLVERFDRIQAGEDWRCRAMVSALTIPELKEMQALRELPGLGRGHSLPLHRPTATLRELFARLTFNILVGNVDDHARNRAAFGDDARSTNRSNEDLSRVHDACGIHRGFQATHERDRLDTVLPHERVLLADPDAMLPRASAADR